MEDKLQELKTRMATLIDLLMAANVLDWDQETYMPPGGAQARGDQVATLQELAHRFITDEAVGKLLDDLAAYEQELDYDSDEAALIRVTRREYDRRTKVPPALVAEYYRTKALATEAWKEARQKSDFRIFEPLLDKMVEIRHQWAECFKPYDNIYDPLIDEYEPGMTSAQIEAVFSGLKPHLVALVQDIVAHQDAVDDSPLHGDFDPEAQMAFGREVVAKLGYDFERGRLDLSAHPFTIHFTRDDVRITTRILRNFLPSCLMGIIHEGGHAMYEQNTSPHFYRTPLAFGASMATHESQSRFYENVIGRSRPFWKHFYPRLQEAFPQLKGVSLEAFYRALNKSQPSLIRVEADEVTYGLHIMLRFELENAILNGQVRVADLPKEWNGRMEAYLGIVPPNDREGVLQDIHWSQGYIGYFPDYLLGSIFSVQLWEQMQQDIPDVTEQIEAGKFDAILAWNTEHIYRHGMKYTLPELAQRITGRPLTWEPYLHYLRTKYGEIYGL